jgi:hypothetical protein
MQTMMVQNVNLSELLDAVREIVVEEVKKHMKAEAAERLLSPDAATKLFQPVVSKQTLHKWTKLGLIPSYRIGGRVFYKESEVIQSAKSLKIYKHNIA